jgi:hypothetical protein
MIAIPNRESSHWYYPDARACFELPAADGTMRKPTLRDARKLGLLPSVTGILRLWPADALKNWLRGQDILAAGTTPRLPTESDDQWVARVLESADEVSALARTTGTRRHALIEQFNRGALKVAEWDAKDLAFCEPYFEWFRDNVVTNVLVKPEHIVVNAASGYAGTLDLECQTKLGRAIVDVKNRKKPAVYDTDAMQLIAYASALGEINYDCYSIILGTDTKDILVRQWTPNELELAGRNFRLCLALWKASKNYDPCQPS